MVKKIITYGNIGTERQKFHRHKSPIFKKM